MSARELLRMFDALHENLETMARLSAIGKDQTSDARANTLAAVWSQVGGNKVKLEKYEETMGYLVELDVARREAYTLVQQVIGYLEGKSVALQDVRVRTTLLSSLEDPSTLPYDYYAKSLQKSFDRLGEKGIGNVQESFLTD